MKLLLLLVGVLALVLLGHDAMTIMNGTTDLNRHMPFLVPAVLGCFIVIGMRINRMPSKTQEFAPVVVRRRDTQRRDQKA